MVVFNGKQHISLGIIFAIVIYLPLPKDILYFALGILTGSLLPDVDHKQSIAGAIIPLWLVFKHGRQTHTIIVNSLFLIPYWLTGNDVWYGITIAYASHLAADNLSGNNLKYLYYPFRRRK